MDTLASSAVLLSETQQKEDVSMSESHDMALCDLRPLNSPAAIREITAIRDEGIPSTV